MNAGAAWEQLRRGQQVRSLAQLIDLAGRPVVAWRCAAHRELVACVWRVGPGKCLMVTGHRTASGEPAHPPPGTGVFVLGDPVQGRLGSPTAVLGGEHEWVPGLALLDDDIEQLFPLRCPSFQHEIPEGSGVLADDTVRALTSVVVRRDV